MADSHGAVESLATRKHESNYRDRVHFQIVSGNMLDLMQLRLLTFERQPGRIEPVGLVHNVLKPSTRRDR